MKQEAEDNKSIESNLKEEAKQYYNMAKDYRRDRYMKDESEAYVMNKQWLKKWKEYVNYRSVKQNIQYSYYYSQYNKTKNETKEGVHPGPIDNENLLVPLSEFLNNGDTTNPENVVIRHDVDQKEDVKIVNKAIWDFFYSKYGGGPVIKKGAIEEKSKYSAYPKKIIEIFYRKINVLALPRRKDFTDGNISRLAVQALYISRTKSVNDLKTKYISVTKAGLDADVSEKNLRLWKLNTDVSMEQFKKALIENSENIRTTDEAFNCDALSYLEYVPNSGLDDIDLADTDTCVIEYRDGSTPWIFEVKKVEMKEGKCEWCNSRKLLRYFCNCKEAWYCCEPCLDKDKNIHQKHCKKRFEVEENNTIRETERSRRGLVGLQNLGNTCFMNTSLQCMSNCWELTQYFLKDYYKKDINVDNPIGTSGVLARAYANFLKNVWYGDSGVFSPWNFKRAISTFQSMFSGYQQHDTQEFLNYLLDGLHEDLNKVLKKPLVEKDDSKKDDAIKSKEQWIGFLRRNQSALVDLLYGQFKSTLHCPDSECQNVSTTFDPFLSMSLPLVAKTETYEVICFFIFHNIEIKPIQLTLPFSMETTIMALRNKVSKILDVHPYSFFVIKMDAQGSYDHLVHSSALLKINNYYQSVNQKPFFLFQIDPEIFYSPYNKYIKENPSLVSLKRDFSNVMDHLEEKEEENKKLFSDDYEEDENGATTEDVCYYSKIVHNTLHGRQQAIMKVNTDDNYGFDQDWVKVVMFLKKYDESYNSSNRRTRIIFPRIIYLNKNWNCKKAHHVIFKYYANLLRVKYNLSKEVSDEKLWEKYFPDLNTDIANDSIEFHKKNSWPYRIRLNNIFSTRNGNCPYCDRSNCDNCLLPYSENITIGDLISKIPKNDDLEQDNTYLFLNDKQKFYANQWNRDFSLEITWLQDYVTTVQTLNDKKDYDFKIHKALRNKSVSIYDCFKNFVKLEKLEENNEWYCPECKKFQKATKKMEIYKAPHILIVHLKRFRNHSKIDTVVDFPIEGLDIHNYVISNENNLPLVYDLFAIGNHYGSMGFGHYISYAKNPIDKQWYEFDDSHVSKKSKDDLVSSSAYVLFYRRRDLEKYINPESIYNKPFINYENFNINNMLNEVDMNNCSLNPTCSAKSDCAMNIDDQVMENTKSSEESKSKESN